MNDEKEYQQKLSFPGRELPTIYANRFSVFVGPFNTRIVFGEMHHPSIPEKWLMSIVLPTTDIEEFCQTVPTLLSNMRKQIAEKEAENINRNLVN